MAMVVVMMMIRNGASRSCPPRRPNAEDSDPATVDAPSQAPNPPDEELDSLGLPKARNRASDLDFACDPYSCTDHLSVKQCAGFDGYSFREATVVPRQYRER